MTDQETSIMLDAYLKCSRSQGIIEGIQMGLQLKDFNKDGVLRGLKEVEELLQQSRDQMNGILMKDNLNKS
jgi:hypothetical protein